MFFDNFEIKSIDDVPDKYKQGVLNIDSSDLGEVVETPMVVAEFGEPLTDETAVAREFASGDERFFGHGTISNEIVEEIFKTGLNVKNSVNTRGYDSHLRGLTSTSIIMGIGDDELFKNNSKLLNNWPHKSAKKIVIVSLPEKYCFKNGMLNSSIDCYEQFYVGNEDNGYKLRSEFIKGVYDADNKTFTPNNNFYKNLPIEEQNKLFEEIESKYITSYANNATFLSDDFELPLSDSKRDELYVKWYAHQLKEYENHRCEMDEMLNDDVKNNDEEIDYDIWK